MYGTPTPTTPGQRRRGGGSRLGSVDPYASPYRRSPSAAPSQYSHTHSKYQHSSGLRYAASDIPKSPTIKSEYSDDYRDLAEGSSNLRRNTVFIRDEISKVASYGGLPTEVQEEISLCDLYVNTVRAKLDPTSGFALVCVPRGCFVWNYVKQSNGSPTCYIFPNVCDDELGTPFAHLVSHGLSREPGLIMLSQDGRIRYWEGVSAALTFKTQMFRAGGREGSTLGSHASTVRSVTGGFGTRAVENVLQLSSGESLGDLWAFESTAVLISTTSSRLMKVTVTSLSGNSSLQIVTFKLPSTGFIFGFGSSTQDRLFSGKDGDPMVQDDEAYITDVTVGNKWQDGNARDVWVMSGFKLQRWRVGIDGPNYVSEHSIRDDIVSSNFLGSDTGINDSLRLISINCLSNCEVVILASYNKLFSETDIEKSTPMQSHAVIRLRYATTDSRARLSILEIRPLQYDAHVDPRRIAGPTLTVSGDGNIAFVQFTDAIICLSLRIGAPYETVAHLRDPTQNVFLGLGFDDVQKTSSRPGKSKMATVNRFFTVTSRSGIVVADMDLEKLKDYVVPSQGLAHQSALQTKVEQAVYFGKNEMNPIDFQLHPGFKGSLDKACEDVSLSIITGASSYNSFYPDVGSQLESRVNHLRRLIDYVRSNGMLGSLSKSCLRKLAAHANIAATAKELWHHLDNTGASTSNQNTPEAMCADAIRMIMATTVDHPHENPLKAFFGSHLLHLGTVLPQIEVILKTRVSSLTSLEERTRWQLEANHIYSIAYDQAIEVHHRVNTELYNIPDEQLAPTEHWLTDQKSIACLDFVYFQTCSLIKSRTQQYGTVVDDYQTGGSVTRDQTMQAELKDYLKRLIDPFCFAMQEQLRHLAYREQHQMMGLATNEKLLIKDRYTVKTSEALQQLYDFDLQLAFSQAEHYRKFDVLVDFCRRSGHAGRERLEKYMDEFGYDFAEVLFDVYAEQGELYQLLDQSENHNELLTSYFKVKGASLDRISWVHNMRIGDFELAGQALESVAATEANLETAELMLSIGKLSYMAKAMSDVDPRSAEIWLESGERTDDRLAIVTLGKVIRESIVQSISATTSLSNGSVPAQIEHYVTRNCQDFITTRPRPGMIIVVKDLVQRLLTATGRALDFEDLVDVMTLKDNLGQEVRNYVTALTSFVIDKDLPRSRKESLLAAIWRRIYLRDNWIAIAQGSGISEAEARNARTNTAAAQVIKELVADSAFPNAYILKPSNVLATPANEELYARFGDEELVHQLLREHHEDVEALQKYISDGSLDEVFNILVSQ